MASIVTICCSSGIELEIELNYYNNQLMIALDINNLSVMNGGSLLVIGVLQNTN
jgi:hypothetical protein